jgi:hypothetical protein
MPGGLELRFVLLRGFSGLKSRRFLRNFIRKKFLNDTGFVQPGSKRYFVIFCELAKLHDGHRGKFLFRHESSTSFKRCVHYKDNVPDDGLLHFMAKVGEARIFQRGPSCIQGDLGHLLGREGQRVETDGGDSAGEERFPPVRQGPGKQAAEGLRFMPELRRMLDAVGEIRHEEMRLLVPAEGRCEGSIPHGKPERPRVPLLVMIAGI